MLHEAPLRSNQSSTGLVESNARGKPELVNYSQRATSPSKTRTARNSAKEEPVAAVKAKRPEKGSQEAKDAMAAMRAKKGAKKEVDVEALPKTKKPKAKAAPEPVVEAVPEPKPKVKKAVAIKEIKPAAPKPRKTKKILVEIDVDATSSEEE